MPLYGGIDLHANNSVVALLNEQDQVIYQRRLANHLPTILEPLEGVLKIMPGSVPTAAASAESSRASAGFHWSGACAHSLCSSDAAAPASLACVRQSNTTVSRQIPARETSA